MRKKIGSKVIQINNFEFIKEAFKGKHKTIQHGDVARVIDFIDMELIKDCVACYYQVMDKLVFPLNCFEGSVKYATVFKCMQYLAEQEENSKLLKHFNDESKAVNVTNGLTLAIDDYVALEFISDSWRMIDIQYGLETDIKELEDYQGELGYAEYLWVYDRICKGQNLTGYYMKFMPELWEVCGGKLESVTKEVEKLLKLEPYGSIIPCNDCHFIDVQRKVVHHMVIKVIGKIPTEKKVMAIQFNENNECQSKGYKKEYLQTYDYELYTMGYNGGGRPSPHVNGLDKVLQKIVAKHNKDIYRAEFKGYFYKGYVVFELDGDLYKCTLEKDADDVELIEYNSHVVDLRGHCVYYKKATVDGYEVYKEHLENGKHGLCEVIY